MRSLLFVLLIAATAHAQCTSCARAQRNVNLPFGVNVQMSRPSFVPRQSTFNARVFQSPSPYSMSPYSGGYGSNGSAAFQSPYRTFHSPLSYGYGSSGSGASVYYYYK